MGKFHFHFLGVFTQVLLSFNIKQNKTGCYFGDRQLPYLISFSFQFPEPTPKLYQNTSGQKPIRLPPIQKKT